MAKLVHRSIRFDRTKIKDGQGRLEKIAAKAWEDSCRRNNFEGPRANILMSPPARDSREHFDRVILGDYVMLTQQQATAMATVFQWMFTNVGRSAMLEVYEKAGWKVTITPPAKKTG